MLATRVVLASYQLQLRKKWKRHAQERTVGNASSYYHVNRNSYDSSDSSEEEDKESASQTEDEVEYDNRLRYLYKKRDDLVNTATKLGAPRSIISSFQKGKIPIQSQALEVVINCFVSKDLRLELKSVLFIFILEHFPDSAESALVQSLIDPHPIDVLSTVLTKIRSFLLKKS
jgi:hypothetical protein